MNLPIPPIPTVPLAVKKSWRSVILLLWGVLIGCIVFGSLLPASSGVINAIGLLHVSDKVQHFAAYLALALLPVAGFENRNRGILAGLSMFLLGVLLEGLQHFSPGRAVELGDVIANGLGVAFGILMGIPAGRLSQKRLTGDLPPS
jgi:hypothetical protein